MEASIREGHSLGTNTKKKRTKRKAHKDSEGSSMTKEPKGCCLFQGEESGKISLGKQANPQKGRTPRKARARGEIQRNLAASSGSGAAGHTSPTKTREQKREIESAQEGKNLKSGKRKGGKKYFTVPLGRQPRVAEVRAPFTLACSREETQGRLDSSL